MIDNVIIFGSLIKSLLSIGVNLTGKQYELLKWRTSEDAKKYYTDQENKEFYNAIKNGNVRVIDAIRKEKQERINSMKRKLFFIPLIFSIFVSSCNTIPKYEESWDINSLRDEEKTYQIKSQDIKVNGKLNKIHFNSDWYLVHRELIKTYNENQDNLLETLNLLDETKKKKDRTQIFLNYTFIGCIILFILLSFQLFKGRR